MSENFAFWVGEMDKSPFDFYRLTWSEFSDVVDVWVDRQKADHRNRLALAWNIANLVRAKELPEFKDLVASTIPKEPQTEQQMFEMCRVLNAAFGGKEVIHE